MQCSAVEEAEARRRGVCERIRVTAGSKLRGAATRCRHSRRRSARHQTRTQLSRHTLRSLYYSLSLSLSLSVYLSFTRCQLPLATFTAFFILRLKTILPPKCHFSFAKKCKFREKFCHKSRISPISSNFVKKSVFCYDGQFSSFRQFFVKTKSFGAYLYSFRPVLCFHA